MAGSSTSIPISAARSITASKSSTSKPQQHTVTVRSVVAISNGAVMMFDFKTVQLQQDELPILHQLLIFLTAMSPATPQQTLIPLAAGLDIRHTDKWLSAHISYPSRNSPSPEQI